MNEIVCVCVCVCARACVWHVEAINKHTGVLPRLNDYRSGQNVNVW